MESLKIHCPDALWVAHNDAFQDDRSAGLGVDQIGGRLEDLNDAGAHGAAADESDIQRWRSGHVIVGRVLTETGIVAVLSDESTKQRRKIPLRRGRIRWKPQFRGCVDPGTALESGCSGCSVCRDSPGT